MDSIHVYVQKTKLNNVSGRVNYATNPEVQQEKLLAIAGQTNRLFWDELAKACNASSKNGECIQGIELMAYLPNKFLEFPETVRQRKLDNFARYISDFTGTECLIALHDSHPSELKKHWTDIFKLFKNNKSDVLSNTHIHMLLSERPVILDEIYAKDRAVYLDENGKKCRTKKEICNEAGELKPGCKIIRKGETYTQFKFGSKKAEMSTDWWLEFMKQEFADWINKEIEPDKKRIVYDPDTSVYIPLVHIKKGTPEEQANRMKQANNVIREYNTYVRDGVISLEDAEYFRDIFRYSPDKAAEAKNCMEYLGLECPEYTPYQEANKDTEKEKLRQLYRDSKVAWDHYKAIKDKGTQYEIRDALNAARSISVQIDAQKKALGIYGLEQYQKAEKQKKKELMFQYKWLNRLKSIKEQEEKRRQKYLDYINSLALRIEEALKSGGKNTEMVFLKAELYLSEGIDLDAPENKGKSIAVIRAEKDVRAAEYDEQRREQHKQWEEEMIPLLQETGMNEEEIERFFEPLRTPKNIDERINEESEKMFSLKELYKELKNEKKEYMATQAEKQKEESERIKEEKESKNLARMISNVNNRKASEDKNGKPQQRQKEEYEI